MSLTKKARTFALAAALLTLCCEAARAQATFMPLGDLPGGLVHSFGRDVSADGSVVVGPSRSAISNGFEAFRWTVAGAMVGLGDLPGGPFNSLANSVSADGTVVVGQGLGTNGPEAIQWTSNGGMLGLGELPGGDTLSLASATSADGAVVVGESYSANGREAFRWTNGGGMVGLGELPGGSFSSTARALTANGLAVVGEGNSANGFEAFRWTAESGMIGLGDLPGGDFSSTATSVTPDLSVVVGISISASGREAFRWTDGGMIGLGDLPGGPFESLANDVSADGSVVVGASLVPGDGSIGSDYDAFYWTEARGMVSLRQLLIANGATNLNGWTLYAANAVSANGLTIVGNGVNPAGIQEGWVATIPEPNTLTLAALTLLALLAAWARRRNYFADDRSPTQPSPRYMHYDEHQDARILRYRVRGPRKAPRDTHRTAITVIPPSLERQT